MNFILIKKSNILLICLQNFDDHDVDDDDDNGDGDDVMMMIILMMVVVMTTMISMGNQMVMSEIRE